MKNVNPIIRLAATAGKIDALQAEITKLEGMMEQSILGNKLELAEVEIRELLTRCKAALGFERTIEDGLKQELLAERDARKNQGELGNA
jgi:hypothetical protein